MLFEPILYLIIYSFLGWCCECIYCSIGQKRIVNRGFMTGPFCPIYGFGALGIIHFLAFLPSSVLAVFLGSMFIASVLEYITGVTMEKIFHTRWWDYSEHKFNLNGHICLLNAVLFGLLGVVLKFDMHPAISSILSPLSDDFKMGFLVAFGMYFCIDLSMSIYSVLNINIRLDKLHKLRLELEGKYDVLDKKQEFSEFIESIQTLDLHDELFMNFQKRIENIGYFQRRLLNAFPKIENKKYPKSLSAIKQTIRNRVKTKK